MDCLEWNPYMPPMILSFLCLILLFIFVFDTIVVAQEANNISSSEIVPTDPAVAKWKNSPKRAIRRPSGGNERSP